MTLEIQVLPDAEAVAAQAAEEIATLARERVADRGRFTFAVSGGRTPWAMFSALRALDVPWERVEIFQVDERVAQAGSTDRNLTHLIAALPPIAVGQVRPMPVEDQDLEASARRYAASLPDRLDLVHLGLGPDGHTASLVPDDPVLDVTDRDVAITQPYQGHRRMTLTYPTLDRAARILWLVMGSGKAEALRELRAGGVSIPASRVRTDHQTLLCDEAAADGISGRSDRSGGSSESGRG